MLIPSIIIFIVFVLLFIGDAWSTSKGFKFNHKLLHNKKYYDKVRKVLLKDETKAEMDDFSRKLMKRYGPQRAMLYLTVFGAFPLSLLIFYLLLTEFTLFFPVTLFALGLMSGLLYGQIWRALHYKEKFGFKI